MEKIKREEKIQKNIDKTIGILLNVLQDNQNQKTVAIFITACIEKAIGYENIGNYYLMAPIPGCDVCCESYYYRSVVYEKYIEELIKGKSYLNSILRKYNNFKIISNTSFSKLEHKINNYSNMIDSTKMIIKTEKEKCSH